ncbi:3-oxoacyl-[acyl-carrier-protein] synthase 2 [Planctomycetes bacterium MalM25]|nr:3-oxoacyl-[acyl-carrier-protein] synthase 2 [Planctomycetes bacterium MalM25]
MSSQSKPAERRVVITGVGLVSPLGSSPATYSAALAEGRSGVTAREGSTARPAVGGFATEFSGKIGDFGELEGPQKKAIRKGLKVMCRETQMAVAAAQHALADAGAAEAFDPERVGVVLGSDYMLTLPEDYVDAIKKCQADADFDYDQWGGDGLGEMQPLWMLKYLPNMPASHIAIFNDLRGPNNSLTMREAGGLMAVGEAFRILARGDADRMVAGATGTRVLPMQAIHALQETDLPVAGAGFSHEGPTDADPATLSRPFDAARTGMVCGEGAGMVVLEALDAAQARGAKIYGEVVGFGSSVVAKPGPDGASLVGDNRTAIANATKVALRDAGMQPAELGHVNANGVGAPAADRDEAAALRDALRDAADDTPVVALKSYFGELGAGGGVIELAGSLLAFDQEGPLAGALPRTLNHEQTDPECPIQVAAQAGVPTGDAFLALNTTPQGQAAAVCVKRFG